MMIYTFDKKYTSGKVNIARIIHNQISVSCITFGFSSVTKIGKSDNTTLKINEEGKLEIDVFSAKEAIYVKQALEEIVEALRASVRNYNDVITKENNPLALDELLE